MTNPLLVATSLVKNDLEIHDHPEPHLEPGVRTASVEVELRCSDQHQMLPERQHGVGADGQVLGAGVERVLRLSAEQADSVGHCPVELGVPVHGTSAAGSDPLQVVPGVDWHTQELGRDLEPGVQEQFALAVVRDRASECFQVPPLPVVPRTDESDPGGRRGRDVGRHDPPRDAESRTHFLVAMQEQAGVEGHFFGLGNYGREQYRQHYEERTHGDSFAGIRPRQALNTF